MVPRSRRARVWGCQGPAGLVRAVVALPARVLPCPAMLGRIASVAMLAALAFLVAGCPGRGRSVANAIRDSGSPLIERVEFQAANIFEGAPEEVRVYMVLGATQEQAVAVWCEVVIPAGARPPRDPYVAIWRGEGIQQGVSALLISGHDEEWIPACPPDASAATWG